MSDCIFCNIVQGKLPCVKVFENAQVLAFADINPVGDGHTLVIPKKHAENIHEVDPEDLAAVHQAAQKIAGAMKSELNAEGVLCLQLNGRAVHQEVMHYHLHVVPKLPGTKKLFDITWKMKPGDMDKIKATVETLVKGL